MMMAVQKSKSKPTRNLKAKKIYPMCNKTLWIVSDNSAVFQLLPFKNSATTKSLTIKGL